MTDATEEHVGGLTKSPYAALTVWEAVGKLNGKLTAWIRYEMRSLADDTIFAGTIKGKAYVYVMDRQLEAIEAGKDSKAALVAAVWNMVV